MPTRRQIRDALRFRDAARERLSPAAKGDFVCPVCGADFGRPTTLDRHADVHAPAPWRNSIEAMWYASYDADGQGPTLNRLTRLPAVDQLAAAFDLALDLRSGDAGYRSIGMNTYTGETIWWWSQRLRRKYGDWWYLPRRTINLMERAKRYAEQRAMRSTSGHLDFHDQVGAELRRLQRRSHRAADYVRRNEVVLPAREPPSPKRERLRKLQPAPMPDSLLLACAHSSRRFLLEVRYDLTIAGAARRHIANPHPEWGPLKVETEIGIILPIVAATKFRADVYDVDADEAQ